MRRLDRELELVAACFGELLVAPDQTWLSIQRWPLPPGWNQATTRVLVQIPAGYPAVPPDNFCTDPDLRLDGGAEPGNSSAGAQVGGFVWRQFSFHVEGGDWRPHAAVEKGHNLLTFVQGVRRRLEERS